MNGEEMKIGLSISAVLICIGVFSELAQAESTDCERFNKTTAEGLLDRKECEYMARYRAQKAMDEEKARQDREAYRARQIAEQEARDKAQATLQAEQQAEQAEYLAKVKREEAEHARALKKRQAESDAEDRAYEAETQRRAKADSQRKATCGSDYLNPSIGMAISRAMQCVGTFKVVSQLNRTDGVVTTYRGTRTILHVMDGRVVAWNRF